MGERQDSSKNEPQSGPSVGVDDSHNANSSVIVNMSPHSEKAVRAILSGRIRDRPNLTTAADAAPVKDRSCGDSAFAMRINIPATWSAQSTENWHSTGG